MILFVRKNIDKRERDENQALFVANQALNLLDQNTDISNSGEQSSAQTPKQTHRKSAPKTKTVIVASDGTVVKRYICDYPNCTYSSNWAHDLKGHKRKHTGK